MIKEVVFPPQSNLSGNSLRHYQKCISWAALKRVQLGKIKYLPVRVAVMVNAERQLDWIWSPLRGLPLGGPVSVCPRKTNGERSFSVRVGESF